MKPLNRAERNNAFLSFLLLFLITIGIVITVVFFSTKVRSIEYGRLRNEMLMMQKEKDLANSFRDAMNVVLNELANFDQKKQSAFITQQSVQMKIKRMSKLIRKMPDAKSDAEHSIYELVIQNLADLNDAKTRIRNLEDQKN